MKDAEPTIERLLAGLRDANPQPGLDSRILSVLQAGETKASFSYWNRWRPQTSPGFAIWLASALAIACGLVTMALFLGTRGPADSSHPPTAAVGLESPQKAAVHRAPFAVKRPALRVSSKHARTVVPVPDLRAASFPAPPLPLTAQEKLLLRVAHRRDPQDEAILNPALQATQAVKENEQFQRFFGMNANEMRNQNE